MEDEEDNKLNAADEATDQELRSVAFTGILWLLLIISSVFAVVALIVTLIYNVTALFFN